jgi:hypothetical protein
MGYEHQTRFSGYLAMLPEIFPVQSRMIQSISLRLTTRFPFGMNHGQQQAITKVQKWN